MVDTPIGFHGRYASAGGVDPGVVDPHVRADELGCGQIPQHIPDPLGGTRRGHEHRQNLCAARCHQNCPMFGIWNVCAVGVGAFEVCLSNSGRSGCSARTAHSWISSMSSPVAQCTSGAMSR